MSRAFVKETDEVFDLPDRPVSEHPNLVTEAGSGGDRGGGRALAAALAEAQAGGGSREESPPRSASSATGRRGARPRICSRPPGDCSQVRFGCRVTIERDDGRTQTFRIVGEDEADPAEGTISYVAPLARALIGKEVGDVVRVGASEAEIVAIDA